MCTFALIIFYKVYKTYIEEPHIRFLKVESSLSRSAINMKLYNEKLNNYRVVNKLLEKDYNQNINYKRIPQIKDMGKGTKPVVILSDNNEVIQEFYSVINAGKILGIKPQEVSRICLHKAKTIKFNLKYKDEYLGEKRLNVETPITV